MRFLADMGVDQRVVAWLRFGGHVLTFDLDFGEIAALTRGKTASVVLFRLRDTRAPHIIERLQAVLSTAAEPLDGGAVVIVEESRHRVRPLPIGRPLSGG